MNQNERINIEVRLDDRNVLRALDRIIGRLNDLDRSLSETNGFMQDTASEVDFLGGAFSILAGPIGDSIGKTELFKKAMKFMKGPIGIITGLVGTGLFFAFRNLSTGINDATCETLSFTENLENLITRYEELDTQVNNSRAVMDQMAEDRRTGALSMYEYTSMMTGVRQEYGRLTSEQERNAEQLYNFRAILATQGLQYNHLSDIQRDVVHRMLGYWQIYAEMGSTMFRTLATESELSLRDIVNNMDYNLQATENWQNNIALISRRYGEEVAEFLRAKGEEGMALAAMMATEVLGRYEELDNGIFRLLNNMDNYTTSYGMRIAENLERSGELARDGLEKRVGEGHDAVLDIVESLVQKAPDALTHGFELANFPEIGKAIPDGLIEGVREGNKEAILELSEIAESWGTTVEAILEINSPSQVFANIGENIIEGLVFGLEEYEYKPIDFMQELIRRMKQKFENVNSDFANIGNNVMQGLNQGLLNGEPDVMATATRIANNIAETMQSALAINSPSRLMREKIGRQIPAGVAAGIDKYSDYALDSVYDLGKDLLKVKMPKMSDIINFGPSLSLAGVSGQASSAPVTNDYSIHNDGMFKGATFEIHNDQDVDRIMEEMAWKIKQEQMRIKDW